MVIDMKNQVHKMKIQVGVYKVKVLEYKLISVRETGKKLNKFDKSKNGFLIMIIVHIIDWKNIDTIYLEEKMCKA